MNYPKHKPAILTRRGTRNELYGPGRWEGSRHVGWEGIEAARIRENERAKTVESLVDKVRNRFYITGEHIEDFSAQNTRKLIEKIRRLIGTNTGDLVEFAQVISELHSLELKLPTI